MPLRILALGDAHFQVNNTVEVDAYLAKLKAFLEARGSEIDIIVSMGDVLHTHARLHVVPLNKAVQYFQLLSSFKPTYAIVGNHDQISNAVFLTPDHWANFLKSWADVTVVDDVLIEEIKGHKVVMCPYTPEGRFIEALNTKQGQWEDADVILSHVTIKGANMGNMIAQDADEWSPDYPFLISGHIHLSQRLQPNMYYTGSILQVAVDEDPRKHIVLATVDSESVVIEEVDLGLPRREIIYVELEDIDDFKVPNEPNVKYTLYIQGEREDFKAFLRGSRYKNLVALPQIDGGTHGVKFKPRKADLKEAQRQLQTLKEGKLRHFNDLLRESVAADGDELLMSLWDHLVNQTAHDGSDLLQEEFVVVPRTSAAE